MKTVTVSKHTFARIEAKTLFGKAMGAIDRRPDGVSFQISDEAAERLHRWFPGLELGDAIARLMNEGVN